MKNLGGKSFLLMSGEKTIIPLEHNEVVYTYTNLIVFDGKRVYSTLFNNGVISRIKFEDVDHNCKLFLDAETILKELLKSPNTSYIGRKRVRYAKCYIYKSSSRFFSDWVGANASVEIAMDEKTGLPVRILFEGARSSMVLNFNRPELDIEIDQNHFKPVEGVEYREVKASEYR